MTAKEVRRSYALLCRLSEEVLEKRIAIQAACPHETPTYAYRGSTGNYDPSNDGYWIEWACPDCGKRWHTEQDIANLRRFPGAVKKV